jgi:hypothetical protein
MPEDPPDAQAPDSPVMPSASVVGDLVAAIDAAPSKAGLAAAELEAWFVAHIHNSAISLQTFLFNETHAAKELLRGLLHHLDAE